VVWNERLRRCRFGPVGSSRPARAPEGSLAASAGRDERAARCYTKAAAPRGSARGLDWGLWALPFRAIETQRLYERVADQLAELIRRGAFAVGERLPPERDLARRFGVSRPVVREAMVALEIAGLVEVRTGSGIYVRGAPTGTAQPLVLPDVGPSPFELVAARKLIEPEIARVAAASAGPADLEAIAATLGRMRADLGEGVEFKAADRLFHTRLAAATRNGVLVAVVDQLWESSYAPIFDHLSRRVGLPENRRAALAEHEHILTALERRDGEAAREAMRQHLAQVESVLMKGSD
jgi:DNA-binding FadR family transcriptional regulator